MQTFTIHPLWPDRSKKRVHSSGLRLYSIIFTLVSLHNQGAASSDSETKVGGDESSPAHPA